MRRLWTKKLLKCGVFIWFSMVLIKNLKCLLSVLALVKNLERDRALFYLFSGLDVVTRKRNPPGVNFKPFSRLPKHEKIAERPCYFHAR
jgi:hypothetical protein